MSDDERPADQTDARQRAQTAALPGPELEPLLRAQQPGTGPAKIARTAPVPSTPPTDHPPGLWVRGSRRIL